MAVHLVWPAGRAGRLRRVALRCRGGFCPPHWITGLLRPGGPNLTTLDLDLRGAALPADFGDGLADPRWGLPPTLRALTLDATALWTSPRVFLEGVLAGDAEVYDQALVRCVAARCPRLERLALRLDTGGRADAAAANVHLLVDLLVFHQLGVVNLRDLEVDVGPLHRVCTAVADLVEGALQRLGETIHAAVLDGLDLPKRLVVGCRGTQHCLALARTVERHLAPSLRLLAQTGCGTDVTLRLGHAVPDNPAPGTTTRRTSLYGPSDVATVIVETVRQTLVAEGLVRCDDGCWQPPPPSLRPVRHLVRDRMDRYPTDPAYRVGDVERCSKRARTM